MGVNVIKAIWLFMAGVVLITISLTLFFLGHLDQQFSFIIMVTGLLLSGLGSIYGKRKMCAEFDNVKPETAPQLMPANPTTQSSSLQQLSAALAPKSKAAPPQAVPVATQTTQIQQQPVVQPLAKPPVQPQPAQPQPQTQSMVQPKQDEANLISMQGQEKQMPLPPAPSTKVIKVYICPKCGEENAQMNVFCYHCGKKIQFSKRKK